MPLGNPPKPHMFDERLEKASEILGEMPGKLLSMKARPIREMGDYDTDYLSSMDYKSIQETFDESDLNLVGEFGYVCNGLTRLYELRDGTRFLYVEHESGPELILHEIVLVAGAVGTVALAANQVIVLFNRICKALQGRHNKRPRDAKGKFLPVSIEKRTKKGQRLIRQIGKTARSVEKAIKSIDDFSDHDTELD